VRILLVGDYAADPRLGSAKVYYKLEEEFTRLGHHCRMLLAEELGPRPAHPRLRWLLGPVLAARAVARAIREDGPYQVVDAASAEGALLGVRRRLLGGAALVSRSHGLEHLNYQRMVDDHTHGLASKPWHRRLWYPATRLSQVALAARLADRLLVLNQADRDYAVRRGWKREDAIDVVPHGVSQAFLDQAPAPDEPRGRGILYCGSWYAGKGVDYLVSAMRLLAADPDPPRLTVLGPGIPAQAVLEAFPAELRERVSVLPRAHEDEVMRHYREHDLLVMPSNYEGFGMVLVEAMSQRLPVLSTPVGGAPALLGDAAGVLVPPRDPQAIAAGVRRLLHDPALRRRLGEAGRARVEGMSWTATAQRTLECYQRAIDARGPGAG
jgi:glycosyltransferase involved in cell wall biosynthesis